jgi:hypothetical protein
MSWRAVVLLAIVTAAATIAALWWWTVRPSMEAAPPIASASAPAPAPAASAQPVPASAPASAVEYPIEAPSADSGPLAETGIGPALSELFGDKAVRSFFRVDDFAHRFVATVDNLGRAHAPTMLWPINPTAGRFTVDERSGRAVVSADNGLRYAPFVQLVESVDAARAVDLYVRAYPTLQQAYEELGYPNRQFNDRLVAVIDQLLATPDVDRALNVNLQEIHGPIPSTRPWVRYEFSDPALQSLTAGQKMLLRTGPVNERRLKARLAELRRELLKRVAKR